MESFRQICHAQKWILMANIEENSADFQLQLRPDQQKSEIYTANIKSLEGMGQLSQCFDTMTELIQYMKNSNHVQIDMLTNTINIVELSSVKKGRTIKLGQIKIRHKQTIIKKSNYKQIKTIKNIIEKCGQQKDLGSKQVKHILQQLAKGLYKLFNSEVGQTIEKDQQKQQIKVKDKIEFLTEKIVILQKQNEELNKQINNIFNMKADKDYVNQKIREYIEKIVQKQEYKEEYRQEKKEKVIREQIRVKAKQISPKKVQKKEDQNKLMQLTQVKSWKEIQLKQNIDISYKKLFNVPLCLFDLKRVTVLKLADNNLQELPAQFGNLSSLENLDINRNKITSLPESFANLTELKTFWYSENQVEQFPQCICSLKQIQLLYIHNNQIMSLPDSFCNLKMIKTLWMYGNKLQYLPDNFGELKRLKQLQMQNNRLTKLPESICKLTNLQKFYINSNRLVELPQNIGKLTELRTFWIQKNRLQILPKTLGNLKLVKDLQMHDNKLKSLCENFGQLEQLNSLKLTIFPQSQIKLSKLHIEKLKNLKNLTITYHQPKEDIDSFSNQCRERGIQLILTHQ